MHTDIISYITPPIPPCNQPSTMSEEIPASASPLPKPAYTNTVPEHTAEAEQWKHRPPYLVQSADEFGPVRWHGKCQCGRVTYKVNRERPLNAKYCHCRGCQIMHGSPSLWIYYSVVLIRSRSALPVGRHLPQVRHVLHQRGVWPDFLQFRPPLQRI